MWSGHTRLYRLRIATQRTQWYVKTRVLSYGLLVISWKLKSTSLNSKVWVQTHEVTTSSHNVIITILRVTSSNPQVTSLNPRAASSNGRVRVQIQEFKNHLINENSSGPPWNFNSLKISSFLKILCLKSFGSSWGNSSFQCLMITSCFTFPLFHGYGFSRKQCE